MSSNGHLIASTTCFDNVVTHGCSLVIKCGYYKHEVIARFRRYVAKHIPLPQLILRNLNGLKTPTSAEIEQKGRTTKDKDEEKEEKTWISQSKIFGYML